MFVYRRYTELQRTEVSQLVDKGLSDYEVSRRTGVARTTVQRWRRNGLPSLRQPTFSLPADWRPINLERYAYLLGIYLGDGHISRHRRTFLLSIYLDLAHPNTVEEVAEAMAEILSTPVNRWVRPGTKCVRLSSTSPNWTQVFPQHGAGPKHKRRIELVAWQREIVDAHPKAFLRGLIHSDGCRCINEFTVQLKDGLKGYAYPRYFFSNLSEDIRTLFCEQCDRLGIRWSMSNARNVSVSHRDSVALLDSFVGPKS